MTSTTDDYSNNVSTSATLTPATLVMGMIEQVNDQDWFKVNLKAGKVYVFGIADAESTPDPASRLHPALELMDSQGLPVEPVIVNNNSAGATLSFYAKTAGTYYLQASALQGNTGAYGVFMSESSLSWENGPADPPKAAIGAEITGKIAVAAQTDWYIFELQAGSTYVFDLLGDGAGRGTLGAGAGTAALRLLSDSGSGSGLNAVSAEGIGGDPRVTFTPAVSGSYYARVWDTSFGGGSYVLKSWLGGSPASDTLADTPAADVVDGGAGLDTMRYTGKLADFTITKMASGLQVAAKSGGAADTLANIERLQFSDGAIAFDATGAGGQAYRLYQAAFDRAPDREGLGYWIRQLDSGASVRDVATAFTQSREFATLYGDKPTNDALVTKLYANVLHRAPDQPGHDYWVGVLDKGASVGEVLAYFSEGAENQAALATVTGNGFAYTPYGG